MNTGDNQDLAKVLEAREIAARDGVHEELAKEAADGAMVGIIGETGLVGYGHPDDIRRREPESRAVYEFEPQTDDYTGAISPYGD